MTMTREEQIIEAAEKATYQKPPQYSELVHKTRKVMCAYEVGFIDGCVWADSHPNWIPVEERLPPFDCIEGGSCRCSQPVLIYDPIRAWIYVGRYESDDLYGNTYWVYGNGKRPTREVCGGYEIDNVTHWMPLPQPPRKEGNK